MKVLITGGAGFIGSHLANRFKNEGHEVIVLDNFTNSTMKSLSETDFKVINGDIRDTELINKVVKEADLVMHMAASLGVSNIMKNPIEAISTNLYGSEIVLNSCAKFEKRIFIASTSEIYGKNPKQPIAETDDRLVGSPQNHRWTYADTKALEESIATILFRQKGLDVTTIRFFNISGPGQNSESGMVLPNFISAALKNEKLIIHGDGNQSRVFCHIDDAVDAIMKLVGTSNISGEVFNIGGIGEISILELANKVINILNSSSQIEFKSYAEFFGDGFEDMFRRVPDLTKIQSFTSWYPKKDLKKLISDISRTF